jgi:ketosteroid isomerase-like protein
MSEENVEVVRRTYARWARGDMQAGVDLFDPEIVFESFTPDANERIVVTGPAKIAAFMEEFLGQWREYRLFGDEFHDAGDAVFVIGHQTAFGRHSGVSVEDTLCSVWTFREGKVVHLLFDRDRDKALEAAGLSE